MIGKTNAVVGGGGRKAGIITISNKTPVSLDLSGMTPTAWLKQGSMYTFDPSYWKITSEWELQDEYLGIMEYYKGNTTVFASAGMTTSNNGRMYNDSLISEDSIRNAVQECISVQGDISATVSMILSGRKRSSSYINSTNYNNTITVIIKDGAVSNITITRPTDTTSTYHSIWFEDSDDTAVQFYLCVNGISYS